jgi:hypothetical protein
VIFGIRVRKRIPTFGRHALEKNFMHNGTHFFVIGVWNTAGLESAHHDSDSSFFFS